MARTPRGSQGELPEAEAEPREAVNPERTLWDVPTATFVTVPLSDAELEAGVAAGQYQELGARFYIDGLGQPAPPLALTPTPDAADPLRVALALSGGSAGTAAVTLYYGDHTAERRDGSAGGDLVHTYPEPGTYSILAINDYGQEAHAVVTVGPPPIEAPPPPELNNELPEPEPPPV